MPWTDTGIHNIYNIVFRGQATTFPVSPNTCFLGLAIGTPTLSGATEVANAQFGSSPGYARQPIVVSAAPAVRSITNSTACLFASSANPPAPLTVTHGLVYTASTGGILIAFGSFATQLTIVVGSLVNIPVGQFTVTDPGTL